MRMLTKSQKTAISALTFTLLLTCVFAASAAGDLVWPSPPAEPKIKFIRTLSSADDYSSPVAMWFKRVFAGKETVYKLKAPYGVAADAQGRIYVADNGLGAVLVFDETRKKVYFLGESGQGKLRTPIDVKIGKDQRIFVSDAGQQRVLVFDSQGKVSAAYGKPQQLENPAGIALDEERNRLYVVDTKKHQVILFDLKTGDLTGTWGQRGSDDGQFNFPTNIWTDKNGQVYVADTMNFRIQIFSPQGQFIRSIGKAGDGPGQFSRLKGLAVDSEGNIYAADAAFNNFQIFDQQGQLLLWVGGPGIQPGAFRGPAGMYIDGKDRVYVADRLNSRVQLFEYVASSGQASVK